MAESPVPTAGQGPGVPHAARFNQPRAHVEAERNAKVPLRNRQGTGWDVANAALFLASDEAGFITRAASLVDGGRVLNAG